MNDRITRMTPSGAPVRVLIDCGLPVGAVITRGCANDMKLEKGQPVSATYSATAVYLIPR